MSDQHIIDRLFIGGRWVEPASSESIPVIESSTGEVMGSAPRVSAADVDAAVAAARAAADSWSRVPVEERARQVAALGDALLERKEELAVLEAREIGTPIEESRLGQVEQAAEFLQALPGEAAALNWQERTRNATARRVPIGVAAAITAWNFPLQIVAAKAGAAMTAGCPVVVKVSEIAPLGTFALAEAAERAGIPPGVLNLLSGYGHEAGDALSRHRDVDKLSFTGSVATARAISAAAAPTLKALHLELGGKSASVILDDADLETAVAGSLANAFQGTGQVCCATTRVLVPRASLRAAEEIADEAIRSEWPVGDPLDEATKLGPLVSKAQQERVTNYIQTGIDSGARLITGGVGLPPEVDRGFFVRPTVFSGSNELAVAREEIFGPVVVLIGYDGGEEGAAEVANDTRYGLGGAVWSADDGHAAEFAARLRTGQVEVNGATWDGTAPFGGFGDSGYGRENGRWGIDEYTTWQAVHLPTA